MPKRSRRYKEASAKLEEQRAYSSDEAVELLLAMPKAKFDEAVELHLHINADPKLQGQQIRETAALPKGTGKQVKVIAFTTGEYAAAVKDAGADYVADDEMIDKIEKGWVDFDVAVASQDMMPKIAKLGRVLGRKGLMPNPRTGTVVKPEDVAKAVDAARKGRIELRLDKTSCIHASIGVRSFEKQDLLDNLSAVCETIVRARPEDIKGNLLKSATLCTTMGPAIKLQVDELEKMTTN